MQIPNDSGMALISLIPIDSNKEINSDRVGKFIMESARYSYAAGFAVNLFATFGKSPFK